VCGIGRVRRLASPRRAGHGALVGDRGPDAQGDHHVEIDGRQVYLGHRRLSIIDLSEAGNQPMPTADGRVVLVYNGEVYNFEALRDRYLRNVTLRSRTDTEVILRLYELWVSVASTS